MAKATWNGTTIAESDETIIIEGNHYFPPSSIKKEHFEQGDMTTHCPWKGDARYYNIVVDGKTNENAAWYYPDTSDRAKHFENYVAFWNGVTVEA